MERNKRRGKRTLEIGKMKYKILVTGNVPSEWAGQLFNIADIDFWTSGKDYLMPRHEVMGNAANYHAILNFAELRVDEELLTAASKLKIVANASIGYDNLDLDALKKRKIWASNSPGFFNFAVAEYIIAGILFLSRRMLEADHFVRSGRWNAFEPGRWDGKSLREQRLGIIRMGAIGKELSAMARCMGMEVKYFDKYQQNLQGFTPMEELLPECDFISVNVPLTLETYQMVNKSFIEKLKKGAILVNTSRGAVIEQEILIQALKSGRLGGAVLDVFLNEPEVPRELLSMNNVILSPHIAGGTKTSRRNCLENAFLNIQDCFVGKRPRNALIDFDNED